MHIFQSTWHYIGYLYRRFSLIIVNIFTICLPPIHLHWHQCTISYQYPIWVSNIFWQVFIHRTNPTGTVALQGKCIQSKCDQIQTWSSRSLISRMIAPDSSTVLINKLQFWHNTSNEYVCVRMITLSDEITLKTVNNHKTLLLYYGNSFLQVNSCVFFSAYCN